MQPDLQPVPLPEPRVFQYSLDWRFLLPVSDPAKIQIAFEWESDFSEALNRIGIPVVNQLFAPDFTEDWKDNTHSFVLPFGLPRRWVTAQHEEQIEFYGSVRKGLCPGGYFLLGFQNFWTLHPDARYHAPTPRRVAEQLRRAGFNSIKIFGAIPNLRIPEYIFELSNPAMSFALLHRFQRKPVLLSMMQTLIQTLGTARVSDFLPCYFVLAMV